mmetsp:Transcript_10404/g.37662  ORF Transcript_10404/g.37662 Transcript_10404/m.37662 type:complete len:378 (+) Transcript_10404:260-1393(+)
MPPDPLNLRHVLEPLLQRRLVLFLPFLPRQQRSELRARVRFPTPHVHVVRPREHVRPVHAKPRAKHPLHPLQVVHIPRVPAVVVEYPNRAIVRPRDELPTRRGVVHVEHRGDEIPVHARRDGQLSHVVRVQIRVLVRDREVKRLHRVPRELRALVLHHELAYRRLRADVVQRDGAIAAAGREDVRLHRVETHRQHRVDAPPKRVRGLAPVRVPQLDRGARGRVRVFTPVAVHVPEPAAGFAVAHEVGVDGRRRNAARAERFAQSRGREPPHAHGRVVAAGDAPIAGVRHRDASDRAAVPAQRAQRPSRRHVPEPYLAVGGARDDGAESHGRLREARHAVAVAFHRADERLREHLVQLGRVQRALVLLRAVHRVQRGV